MRTQAWNGCFGHGACSCVNMQASDQLSGVELDGNVHTTAVTSNVFVRQEHGVSCAEAGEGQAMLRNVFCAGARERERASHRCNITQRCTVPQLKPL